MMFNISNMTKHSFDVLLMAVLDKRAIMSSYYYGFVFVKSTPTVVAKTKPILNNTDLSGRYILQQHFLNI